MHYYIDGYNLLFRTLQGTRELRTQREALVIDLDLKAGLLGLDITVVFDAFYQPEEGTRSHFHQLKIYFTALNETADDYIVQEVKASHHPNLQTVVTSDRDLARRCRLSLANIQTVEEFISWMNKRCKNKLRVPHSKTELTLKPLLQRPLVKPPITIPQSPPESKNLLSKSQSSIEACFDAYLEAFEKAIPPQKEKKIVKIKAKKTYQNKINVDTDSKLQDPHESDMVRWLRAFEQDTHIE